MPQPVEPVGFKLVHCGALALLLEGHREGLGKKPDLFGEARQGQADGFKWIHRVNDLTEGHYACGQWTAVRSGCPSNHSENFGDEKHHDNRTDDILDD